MFRDGIEEGINVNPTPTEMLKGIVRSITPTPWAALAVVAAASVFAVVAASLRWWTLVVLAFTVLLLVAVLILILGFNRVSYRLINYSKKLAKQMRNAKSQPPRVSTETRLSPIHGSAWYWSKQLRSVKGQLNWFITMSMQTRLHGAREVLAYAATKDQYNYRALGALLESARIPMYRQNVIEHLRPLLAKRVFLGLGRVLYSQRRNEMDFLDALTIYELTEEIYGPEAIQGGPDRSIYGDLLIWRGRHDKALTVLGPQGRDAAWTFSQQLLRLNALNPNLTGDAKRRHEWLESLNDLLGQHGLAPLRFRDLENPSFFDISCEAPAAHTQDGPKISVIMPIYEPDEATDLAIRSLLDQTWRNLEIIIVDDASPSTDHAGNPTPYRQQLEGWVASDSRVRVHFAGENRGAYSVRNDGLDMATGEFVTIADKDDWHHPQKFEFQASYLMENPDQVATMTNWVRVDPEMKFLIRSGTGKIVYQSFASLMFRREPVMEKLGYWDAVRKGGDAEFRARLEAVFGQEIWPAWQPPMAFSLLGTDNLTSADMGAGYLSPDRRAYSRAYKAWHQQIIEGESDPYMPKQPESRRFVAPPSFLPERASLGTPHFDVVFMSEFGFMAGNSTSLRQEIQVALDHGLKVGVLPVQNGLFARAASRQFHPKLEEMVLSGQVERISLDTAATADLVVVRWPASLYLDPGTHSKVETQQVVVVANHIPYEVSGERRSYDIREVSANLEATFGIRPTWAAQSETIEGYLEPLVPPKELAPFTWKGIIEPGDWTNARGADPSRAPVIGRHARDEEGKWPSSKADFQRIYPTDGSVHVQVMGGAKTPVEQGHLPAEPGEHWTVIPFNGMPVPEYLQSLDFFVYYHSDGLVEAFGMSILEAINQGAVAVLPPHFKPIFKDAAVYAKPKDVIPTVLELWEDAENYAAQQQRGFDFISNECTPSAYMRRLELLRSSEKA